MNNRQFDFEKGAYLTAIFGGKTPDEVKANIDLCAADGAEAYCLQLEQLDDAYRTESDFRDIFAHTGSAPVYVTNYRRDSEANKTKSDDQLASEIELLADSGAELCDVMGDIFDPQPNEITYDENAIEKQKALIDSLHKKGTKVLMSSHVLHYIPAEEVLKIARAQESRGVDVCKIVTGADSMEQQIENLRIIDLLKKELTVPFLFLCGGECRILRCIGGEIGSCMYLGVHDYAPENKPVQPRLCDIKAIRDTLRHN